MIRGQVKDATGGVLPGVSVEAKSSALQGLKTTTTAGDGTYRIPLLPPGDYTISFTLAGFGKVEKTSTIQLDKTVVIDTTMALASATASVTVTGEAPVIDATSSSTGANWSQNMVQTLPVGRNLTSVATKTPNVIPGFGGDSGNIAVQGATGAENNFLIDGVDTTEVQYGRQGKNAPTEFIQEVEVKTGGFQAEYGHAMGGVLNAITKSGGNAFHGDAFGYYAGRSDTTSGNFWLATDNHLQSKADSFGTNRSQTDPLRNTMRADYGADLGGFAWKDRIWFFGAYDRVHTGQLNFINNPVGNGTINGNAGPGTGTITNATTSTDVIQQLYAGKLTFTILEGLTLVGSVFGDPQSTGPNLATPILGSDLGTFRGSTHTGGIDYTGRLSGVVASNFLFELQAAKHNEQTEPVPIDIVDRRFQTVTPSGVATTGGFGFHQNQAFERNYYRGSASYYANFLGTHELKGGADYTQNQANSQRVYTGPSGNKETVFIRNFSNPCPGSSTPGCQVFQHEYNSSGQRDATGTPIEVDIAPGGTISKTNNTGVFLQDKWQVLPTLTLNVGYRWESQDVKDINNVTQIKINNEWMPRIGFAWDFIGDGRSRFYGSYSKFYETMPLDINIRAFGLEITTAVYNFNANSDLGDPLACQAPFKVCTFKPTAPLGNSAQIKTGGSFGEPAEPGIKGQYSNNYIAGIQYEPWKDFSVGIEYNYRNLGRVIEDGASVDPSSGDLNYFIFNPGTTFINPATGGVLGAEYLDVPPKRYYKAITLTAQKRFNNNLQFLASYVYSKLEGNYDGVFQTSTGQLDPNINSAYDYRYFLTNAYGWLSNDRRNTAKLDGSWVSPWRLTAGLSAFYFTGTPLNAYGYHNGYRNYEYYLVKRGSVGRTPDIYDMDLHLGYSIPISVVDINLGVDVFNLINAQRTLAQDQRFDTTQGTPDANGNETIATAGPLNPNYLQPMSFTPRRTVRAFARITF